jgi:phosphonate transport system permease protein
MTVTAPSSLAASPRPRAPSRRILYLSALAAAVLVVWAALTLDIDPNRILSLPDGVGRLFYRMFLEEGLEWEYLPGAVEGMLQSIQIAWIGTIIGAIISLPLGLLGARNVSGVIGSNVMRQILNAIRAVPEVILAVVIFIPMVGIGGTASAYAGTLAIGLHSVGTLGKLTAEVVEGIDPGPVEAARAAGGNTLQAQRWGVIPQVMPEVIAFWLYRFEINIRASAILGVVGAGGIGTALEQAMTFGRFPRAGLIIIVVIVATILVDTASGWLRRRIIEGSGGARMAGQEFEEPDFAASGAGRVDTDIG